MSKFKTFSTLGELLFNQKECIATLGAAIEEHGIYAVNRGGGIDPHPIDSEQALQALALLTACAAADSPVEFEDFQTTGGLKYGWPIAVIPDFESIRFENERKLTTLNQLLNFKTPVPHADLATQIESKGVYGLDKHRNPRYFGPNSRQAQEALTGVSVHLNHENFPPTPEFEDWYLENDPIYFYGWPKQEVPNFSHIEDTGWIESFRLVKSTAPLFKSDIYTIGRILITRKAKPGAIKTAIERCGVYGLDGTGRVKHYAVPHNDLEELDTVLEQYAEVLMQGAEPNPSLLESAVYGRFGWPRQRLPNFAAIEAEPVPEPPDADRDSAPTTQTVEGPAVTPPGRVVSSISTDSGRAGNGEKANIAMIAALLGFIRGDISPNKHPDFSGQTGLIALFDEKLIPCYGTKSRNWKDKFAKANKMRSDLGLEPLDDQGLIVKK